MTAILFADMVENVISIRFDFSDGIEKDEEVVASVYEHIPVRPSA